MRDWKCTECDHEGQGTRQVCDWCNAPTMTLRIIKSPPYKQIADWISAKHDPAPAKCKQH